jgi:Rod binding domain-containing protein
MMEPVKPISPIANTTTPPQLSARSKNTAHEFEAVFLGQMTKLMMESVDQDSGFSGGHGEEMFRGILAEDLGKEMAKGPGIGISSTVMAEMLRLQQQGNTP